MVEMGAYVVSKDRKGDRRQAGNRQNCVFLKNAYHGNALLYYFLVSLSGVSLPQHIGAINFIFSGKL